MTAGAIRGGDSVGAVTAPLRVLVADDEPLARDDLARLLAGTPNVTVVGLCASGAETVRAARQLAPDVLFLDIRMPGVDGFQVVTQLDAERMPYIVFVTAFDRYAVEAFRVRALDYVLKPVQQARLDDALARAREQLRMRAAVNWAGAVQDIGPEQGYVAAPVATRQYWNEITVRVGAREIVVHTREIEWVEADTYYARLHVGGRSYLLRERMHVLEANLDPKRFIRVHRSAIVNVNHVRELRERGSEHVIVLASGRQVKVSRPRWMRFRAVIRQRSRSTSNAR